MAIAAVSASAAVAQDTINVEVTRGLDTPFTLIYPDSMEAITPTDGAIASIQHREATLQCDIFRAEQPDAGWNADEVAAAFDVAPQEEFWGETFPGFTIETVDTVQFQSGTAVRYVGQSTDSPWGGPAWIEVAEATDDGFAYSFECISDAALDTDALVAFMMQNFSTNSEGECCVGD